MGCVKAVVASSSICRLDANGLLPWEHNVRSSIDSAQSANAYFTLAFHKISAQNRFAAFIAASKGLYSFFLDLTWIDIISMSIS